MRALTLFRAAMPPMVRVPDRSLLPLYRDFLAICNTGDLPKIQQFHQARIVTHPCLFDQYYRRQNHALYSKFMGAVYLNMQGKPRVHNWFYRLATEIHCLH